MSFQQGLSGLNGAQKALDAISNNVANGSTVGFKQSQARFADVFAASLNGGGGGVQVGIGTSINAVAQQFTQGNITVTNNPLDVAINGAGFFRMSDGGTISYTRNGQFNVDKDGYIVNGTGLRLTGYGVTSNGAVAGGDPVDMRIAGDTATISPQVTSEADILVNLDARATPPTAQTGPSYLGAAAPTSLTIDGTNDTLTVTMDSLAPVTVTIPQATYGTAAALAAAVQTAINGNATLAAAGKSVSVTTNTGGVLTIGSNSLGSVAGFTMGGSGLANIMGGVPTTNAGANNFSVSDPTSYTSSTSATLFDSLGNAHSYSTYFVKTSQAGLWHLYTNLDGGAATGPTNLTFDSSGRLTTSMPISESFVLTNSATSPLSFALDLTGSTQFGSGFAVNEINQDGFTSGRLAGISVSNDGILQGRYSNGQTRNLGQVVLASFRNPNGLLPIGGNQWQETAISGQPQVGTPNSGSLGLLQSASIEESNVDLTAELVNMITQQRNYQANAQSIRTQDQLLQTLVNLR